MSIDALAWAINSWIGKGLSGNAKLVLWQIADAHNEDHGAFIRQDTMAKRVEISRATVNRCLDDLEAALLVRREPRVDKATGKQLSTRYRLAFEKGFTPLDVAARVSDCDTVSTGPTGERGDEQDVENVPDRVSKSGGAVSHSSETQTFLEPKKTPLPPSSGVSFTALCELWDTEKLGDLQRAASTFDRLSPEDQQAAFDQVNVTRRCYADLHRPLPQLRSYLHQRAWEECVGAPLVVDGLFKIVADTPEWERWLGHYAKNATVITGMKRQRYLRVPTRWPPGLSPNRIPIEEDA